MIRKILITGGFGYVGGRIAKEISAIPTYRLTLTSRRKRKKSETPFPADRILQLDVSDDDAIVEACAGMDTIIHLAAMNEIDSGKDPVAALAVNTIGTLKLVKEAERAGIKRFLYLSTAHIYRSPLTGCIDERTLPRPVHPYAITHKAAEDFVLASHDRGILCGVVIRLSNGFGSPVMPGTDRWTLLVNDLCRQAVTEGRLTLRSAGTQKRDFVSFFDITRAFLHLIELRRDLIGDGLFNLGGDNAMTVLEMAERVADRSGVVLGHRPSISRKALAGGEDAEELFYDISKLKATGFSLKGDIDREIDDTLIFCKKEFGDIQ
jgi:UDP-glucose 4-epimerase